MRCQSAATNIRRGRTRIHNNNKKTHHLDSSVMVTNKVQRYRNVSASRANAFSWNVQREKWIKTETHKKCNNITKLRTKHIHTVWFKIIWKWIECVFFPVLVYLVFPFCLESTIFFSISFRFASVRCGCWRDVWFVAIFIPLFFSHWKVDMPSWFWFRILLPYRWFAFTNHDICCLLPEFRLQLALVLYFRFVCRIFFSLFTVHQNHLYRLSATDVLENSLEKRFSFKKNRLQNTTHKHTPRTEWRKQIDWNTEHNNTWMAHTIRTQHRT